jgi:hypothetical protein
MLGIYIVLPMALVGVIVLFILYHDKSLKMTSTLAAPIIRSEQREIRDEKERREETVVTVQYKVNGQEYTIEQTLRGRQSARYPVGKTLTVKYNPAEPEMSKIVMG